MFELTEWLSAQPFYNEQQVAQIKSNFNHRVAKMTSEEVNFLLNDMNAKFQIMQTKEAQDAALGRTILVDSLGQEAGRSAQGNSRRDHDDRRAIEQGDQQDRATRKLRFATIRSAFDRTRQEQVQGVLEQDKFARDTYVQDRQAFPTSSGAYSPYSNSSAFQNRAALRPPKQDFGMYVGAYGGFGITLNPSSY